ncbi:MAG: class I SAM-dependent methyltransferase [Pyrinomonadaceae bacterium]|nr:class I SAM-dependent methyltransferase [Sphingobacteriaceae bacterium]
MSILDNASVCRFHHNQIREFGLNSVQSLGWKSEKSQSVRFEILTGIDNMTDCSVMDVGCGVGELKVFLDTKYSGVRYFGIDQMSVFLDIAISRFSESDDTTFFLGDFSTAILPNTDYVLASGAFNYRNSEPDFVLNVIDKLFANCRLGFAFNLMGNINASASILVAYNPSYILKHCQTLSKKVIIKQGYLEDDFTIWMYK